MRREGGEGGGGSKEDPGEDSTLGLRSLFAPWTKSKILLTVSVRLELLEVEIVLFRLGALVSRGSAVLMGLSRNTGSDSFSITGSLSGFNSLLSLLAPSVLPFVSLLRGW